jgi:hypothetical protein
MHVRTEIVESSAARFISWFPSRMSVAQRPYLPLPLGEGRCRPSALVCALWFAIGLCCEPAYAADRIWKANTHQASSVSGELQGQRAQELGLKQLGGTSDESRWPLDSLERLELPHRPRILRGVGLRQFQLVNGDVFHARLLPARHPDSPVRSQELILSGPFASACALPWNGLHAISQSPNTNCVSEFDFETSSPEWFSGSKNTPCVFDLQHAQSGQRSLKCSSEQNWIRYPLPRGLSEGVVQFSFFVEQGGPGFVEKDRPNSGGSIARLQFARPSPDAHRPVAQQSDKRATASVNVDKKEGHEADLRAEINLSSSAGYFDATISPAGQGTVQRLLKKAGWHTLTCQFSATELAIMIDGNLLINRQFSAKSAAILQAVEFVSADKGSPVWIDDVALLEAVTETKSDCLQRAADDVLMQDGDQLFGVLRDIGLSGVRLGSSKRETLIPWMRVSRVCIAEGPIETRPISGWICGVELQPMWTAPDRRQSDRLHGAILSCDHEQITLQHSILGIISLPLEQIRQIRPAYYGFELQFEGRAVHLGDEVKSKFRNPNPSGTHWKRTFRLEALPEGEQRIRVTANQLEPRHPASRPTPLKVRLLSGEFVSEVVLNQKHVAILNDHASGHGLQEMPQEILLRLPKGLLRQGENQLEINLIPSRDAVPEYDDWELLGLALEISLPASGQRPR